MSISLDGVHVEVGNGVAPTVVTVGTTASNAQLRIVNLVPHVVLASGEQLDCEMVLGKSSNCTIACRKGFCAQATAAA